MEDITPKLLNIIQKDFREGFDKSDLITKLYAKVRDGTATYKEANDFAIEVGELLARAYKNNLSSATLPDGKMYYNIAKRIIEPTVQNNYELITDITSQVQKALNDEAGIGIKPIVPELNEDRINGLIGRISSEDIFDEIKWILGEPIINLCQSIVDDSIKVNSEFHAKSGMKPKIIRVVAGNCCEWCMNLAGTYSYPNVPKDVYRRHQRCRCTVDYYPRDGKVQNVHTRQLRNEDAYDRILLSEESEKKEAIRKYLNLNSKVKVSIPPYKINTENLTVDMNHIVNERNRIITEEEAKSFIDDALFSVKVWGGKYERYYGSKGAAYVDLESNMIRTAFLREQYTDNIFRSLEELT